MFGGERVKINVRKLELALARCCKSPTQLRAEVSQTTIQRIYKGEEVKPRTAGKIAKALGVDPAEILESEV